MATVQQLQELRDENQQLQQRYESEIQSKDRHIRTMNQRLNDYVGTIDRLRNRFHQDCQSYQSEIQTKDREIQKLQQQLDDQERVTAEIQQTNNTLQRQVEQLQQQLSQQTRRCAKLSQPPPAIPHVIGRQLQQDHSVKEKQSQPSSQQIHHQKQHPPVRQMKLGEWRQGERAPWDMGRGAVAVDGSVAYFINSDGRTCSYDSSAKIWRKLPQYYCWYSSLAVTRGLLTAIGGNKFGATNELVSMVNNKWVKQLPCMPTKRSHTAVLSTKEYLIVAGGECKSSQLDTVEVMDIETLVWSTAASLPHRYSNASATICGDQLYMLGGCDKGGVMIKSVLTCSLPSLLQSCSGTSPGSVWHRITDVPVYRSTCAAVSGELVAIGGCDVKYKTTSSVHKYDPTTDSWDIISNMPTARYISFVAVLPTYDIMVAGGKTSVIDISNKVEIADIVIII